MTTFHPIRLSIVPFFFSFEFFPFFLVSLAKLREYHGSFKSVCDIFSIDLTEFEQIFGTSEESFQIWDTDNNGLIDALELFSGLILFAEAKFEEKIRCIFFPILLIYKLRFQSCLICLISTNSTVFP